MNVRATLVRTVEPVIILMMPSAAPASLDTLDLGVEQTSMNVAVTPAVMVERVQILSTTSPARVLRDTKEYSAKMVSYSNDSSNPKSLSLVIRTEFE